jgi:hypothetical protein
MNGHGPKGFKPAHQDVNMEVKDRSVVTKDSINLDTGEFMDFLAASSQDFYETLRSAGVKRKGSADAYDVSLPNSPRFADDGPIAKTSSLDILTNVSSLKYDEVKESPQRSLLSNRQFQNQKMSAFEEPIMSPPRLNKNGLVPTQTLGFGSIQGIPSFDFHDSFFTAAPTNSQFHGFPSAEKQQNRDSFMSYAGSDGDSDKNFRGKYKCGRCGQPKVNHNCEFVAEVDVTSTGTQCSLEPPRSTEKFLVVSSRKSILESLPRSSEDARGLNMSGNFVGLPSFNVGIPASFLGQNSDAMQCVQTSATTLLSSPVARSSGIGNKDFRDDDIPPKSPLSVYNSNSSNSNNNNNNNNKKSKQKGSNASADPKSEKFSEEEEIIINILASSSTDYYDDDGGPSKE